VGPIAEGTVQREMLGWPVELIRAELNAVAQVYDLRILLLDPQERVVIDTASGQPLLGHVLTLEFSEPVDGQGQMAAFRTQRLRVDGDDLYLFAAGEAARQAPRWTARSSTAS
jgi:hypothetical protein